LSERPYPSDLVYITHFRAPPELEAVR